LVNDIEIPAEDGFDLDQWQAFVDGRASAIGAYQKQLESRARSKFSEPQNWIWTRKLLEQSSDEWVSRMIANAYPRDVLVHDVCSGAGADSVAIGMRGPVRSLDISPIACLLCQSNLRSHRIKDFAVANVLAESLVVGPEDWIHIDPDRRSLGVLGSGTRTTNADLFMPPLEIVVRLISESLGGSIKVAPTTLADREVFAPCKNGTDIFYRIGKQFVSWGSSVRQQRWWWNSERFPAGSITVSTMRSKDDWYHWSFQPSDSFTPHEFGSISDTLSPTAKFIGDSDPAVRAAGGQLALASELRCEILGSEQGYFFADQVSLAKFRSQDRLIHWFEIEEVMPLDRKKLKQHLRNHGVGTLEIKVRDAPIVPEILRKELKPLGKESRTILICRSARKIIAIIAKRVVAE